MVSPTRGVSENVRWYVAAGSRRFLRRFVTDTPAYMHFDIYGWQPTAANARPKGGVGQATRALFSMIKSGIKPGTST